MRSCFPPGKKRSDLELRLVPEREKNQRRRLDGSLPKLLAALEVAPELIEHAFEDKIVVLGA